jgi:hypothetical protein
MIYAARFETMNALLGFLTESCCGGVASRASARGRIAPTWVSPRSISSAMVGSTARPVGVYADLLSFEVLCGAFCSASGGCFTDEIPAVGPPYSGKPGMLHAPSVQIGTEGAPTLTQWARVSSSHRRSLDVRRDMRIRPSADF